VGGAVGAKKEEVSVAISLVVFWAIVMIFVLPLVARALSLSTGRRRGLDRHVGICGCRGLAAAQTYGGYAGNVAGIAGNPDAAVSAFTLMKVIGRDMWIGVWAFVLSLIATPHAGSAREYRANRGRRKFGTRFPKFVLGFIVASAVVTLVARGLTTPPTRRKSWPALVAPLQAFRTWAFTFAFLSIGLTTRIREFASIGAAGPWWRSPSVCWSMWCWGCVIDPGVQTSFGTVLANEPARPTRLPHLQALQACAG